VSPTAKYDGGILVPEGQDILKIDRVLRMLTTASRSLRLYPPASPIPRQSVEAVTDALTDLFATGADSLHLAVAREGFESGGVPVAVGVPGGLELSAELRAQGVSAMRFSREANGDEILKLLLVLARPPHEVRLSGGFDAQLEAEGVRGVTVTVVQLTVVEAATPDDMIGDGRGNGFEGGSGAALELAADPGKLGSWLSNAAGGDRSDLRAELLSLVEAVGPQSIDRLAASLSTVFAEQSTPTRDALLGLAMEAGPFRDLMAEMFRRQSASEIAGAVLGGSFGRNMLSLSQALTALPLDRVDAAVREQIKAMLPGAGHTDAEARFLDHMIEVRKKSESEPSLAASDQTYLAVAQASAIRPDDLATAGRAVHASAAAVDAAGVRTMLTLLDQQTDPAQVCASANNLGSMVARLLPSGQIALADFVLAELDARTDRVRLDTMFAGSVTHEALGSLIDAVLGDRSLEPAAGRIVTVLGEPAIAPFVAEAIARKAEGLQLAEKFFGRRIIEPLNTAVLRAEWFQLAPVVTRLAQEGDARCGATIEALVRRPDTQTRKEVVNGLTAAGGVLANQILGELVSDPDPDIVVAAARALARSGLPGSGAPIAARIAQLDLDNADFELARELIGALAHTPDRAADELLSKLASRRAILKRGRFNDVQAVVSAARKVRAQEAVGR
jgi:hypothetical protein